MIGYIGVTSRQWFMHLANTEGINEVNFWRKNTNNFKALSTGEPFFFMVKNDEGMKGERAVLGKANFERFEILTVSESWMKYGKGNGDEDKEEFVKRMNAMFGVSAYNDKIGCIILSEFQIFDNPVYLSDIGIEFRNSIVSGKRIAETEVNTILKYGFTKATIMRRINEINKIGFTEDDEGFPEGKHMLKKHLVRERNKEVIELAKSRFQQIHGKLVCEVCEFDFKENYGDLGEGYIEGHHTKPISEMAENEHTKIEDIALVCANCHRMLHRRRPWLSIFELKKLIDM